MKTIRFENMPRMPWKNGLGVTTEIAVHPENATLADASFGWRISMAEISRPGPFSVFSGFDRLLLVWSGGELRLNGQVVAAFEPLKFRGEDLVHAEPTGTIKDLGIVFRRGQFRAEMRRLKVGRAVTSLGRNFVFNAGAACDITNNAVYHLVQGDALDFGHCRKAESFELQAATVGEDVVGILISILEQSDSK